MIYITQFEAVWPPELLALVGDRKYWAPGCPWECHHVFLSQHLTTIISNNYVKVTKKDLQDNSFAVGIVAGDNPSHSPLHLHHWLVRFSTYIAGWSDKK